MRREDDRSDHPESRRRRLMLMEGVASLVLGAGALALDRITGPANASSWLIACTVASSLSGLGYLAAWYLVRDLPLDPEVLPNESAGAGRLDGAFVIGVALAVLGTAGAVLAWALRPYTGIPWFAIAGGVVSVAGLGLALSRVPTIGLPGVARSLVGAQDAAATGPGAEGASGFL